MRNIYLLLFCIICYSVTFFLIIFTNKYFAFVSSICGCISIRFLKFEEVTRVQRLFIDFVFLITITASVGLFMYGNFYGYDVAFK